MPLVTPDSEFPKSNIIYSVLFVLPTIVALNILAMSSLTWLVKENSIPASMLSANLKLFQWTFPIVSAIAPFLPHFHPVKFSKFVKIGGFYQYGSVLFFAK